MSGTNPISTWANPNCTQNIGNNYTDKLEASFIVMQRFGNKFAPHEQTSPNMTVRIENGTIFNSFTLTEIAAQSTGTITAPATNPRIDRIVINITSGIVSVITGTPAGSPTAPALIAGVYPVAQVLIQTSSTSITNSMITDERNFIIKGYKAIADRQTYITPGSTTWTKPSNLGTNAKVLVQVWGGGGSGSSTTSATSSHKGGGGGGSYKQAWFLASTLGSTETIVVGAGGAQVTAASGDLSGNNGGSSSFGSWLTGYGGAKGDLPSPTINTELGGAGGGVFVNSTGKTNDFPTPPFGGLAEGTGASTGNGASGYYIGGGGGAQNNPISTASCSSVFGGGGGGGGGFPGNSMYGGNGGSSGSGVNGTAGTQPGGGGGAVSNNGGTLHSGKGGDGKVIVTTFNG